MNDQRVIRVPVPVAILDVAQERHLDVPRLMRDALVAHIEATRVVTTTISDDDEDSGVSSTISWAVR